LRLIGREPEDLKAVFKVLGLPRFRRGETIDLGKAHAEALLGWVAQLNWSFADDGWKRLTKIAGDRDSLSRVGSATATFVRDTLPGGGDPEHDSTRQSFGEHVINVRTLKMLQQAQRALQGLLKIRLIRGSYATSAESKSAHPHQGGGVIDVSVRDMSSADI